MKNKKIFRPPSPTRPTPKTIPEKDLKLEIHLVNKYENEEINDASLRKYQKDFLYAKIDNDRFNYTFKTNQTFKEVKQIVANLTNLNPKMMSIGKWSSYDEDKKRITILK